MEERITWWLIRSDVIKENFRAYGWSEREIENFLNECGRIEARRKEKERAKENGHE